MYFLQISINYFRGICQCLLTALVFSKILFFYLLYLIKVNIICIPAPKNQWKILFESVWICILNALKIKLICMFLNFRVLADKYQNFISVNCVGNLIFRLQNQRLFSWDWRNTVCLQYDYICDKFWSKGGSIIYSWLLCGEKW